MTIRDYRGSVLPANHNLHLMYPWGTGSSTVTLQPRVPLDRQPIAQQLDARIKQHRPGDNIIGYIITRGDDIHIYIDAGYKYNFVCHNPELMEY